MSKTIFSGNEAVARGAYEAGCTVAAAYPGTPSTEILENVALYKSDIYCEWSCNEKVAAELVSGASIGGARALCAMKHVGMNVATDPIFTMAYAGVNGGLVIVCADDPGCHSSQNEQDNRLYAPHAKIGMLEPSDSQECLDYTKAAFELSERFDIPMLLRMTTRVCHSKSLVQTGERENVGVKPYERRPEKFALLPAVARTRHVARVKSLAEMEEYANDCPFNTVEKNGSKVGVITSGIAAQYAHEVFGKDADYLKLGLTYPLPNRLIKTFAADYETLYVIEELDPYLEDAVRRLGFDCIGKDKIPGCGELNPQIIRAALTGEATETGYTADAVAPPRPPVLCAGCPHRGFFYAVSRKLKKIVPVGDIGCYALGSNAPLNGFDYSICMGAGISSIIGLAKALELQGDSRKALGMLGDSTFFHSGLTSLIDVACSGMNVIACVLDNSITAMTGHQDNPGTVKNLMGESKTPIDILALIRACGFDEDHIRVVDPIDQTAMDKALEDGIAAEGPFVIVTKRPCALIKEVAKASAGKYCEVDETKCKSCKSCMKISCPAIAFDKTAKIVDTVNCTACGLCMQVCKFDAIRKVGE
ncbi:MAG: indolepyruvate ferredoxin oxidoreductase subunit alpha [Oscillospiraceae bacterium]|nr:indolepyruvate ferredoxin oxidoreductase subunit alpha [Oscillospiraceae bacterium]